VDKLQELSWFRWIFEMRNAFDDASDTKWEPVHFKKKKRTGRNAPIPEKLKQQAKNMIE
jgi:hypothetical protein